MLAKAVITMSTIEDEFVGFAIIRFVKELKYTVAPWSLENPEV